MCDRETEGTDRRQTDDQQKHVARLPDSPPQHLTGLVARTDRLSVRAQRARSRRDRWPTAVQKRDPCRRYNERRTKNATAIPGAAEGLTSEKRAPTTTSISINP